MRDSRDIEIAWGGYYASTATESGVVSVFRLIDFNREVLHSSLYSEEFGMVPSFHDAASLTPFVRHVPIDARTLLRDDDLQFLGASPLRNGDIEGYMLYLEQMGVAESVRAELATRLMAFSHQPALPLRLSLVDDLLRVEERI
jgi:hypothetical protein